MSAPATHTRTALCSFPKCGRTWLKLMLKFYYERVFGIEELPLDSDKDWHRIDGRVPKLLIEHDDDPHFKRPDELSGERDHFADWNVILLARDPRDVIVSLYFEMTKRLRFYDEWGFDTSRQKEDVESISAFIRGPVGRLETIVAYYNVWDGVKHSVNRFHALRYEEMHADAAKTLTDVVAFFGLEVDAAAVGDAVEACRFEKMRKYQEKDAFASKTLEPGDRKDPDSYKVRRGKVGGYVDYLSEEDLIYINECCRKLPAFLDCYKA